MNIKVLAYTTRREEKKGKGKDMEEAQRGYFARNRGG